MNVVDETTMKEHRESDIREHSNALLRVAGYDPTTMRNTAGLTRSTRRWRRPFKNLLVLVITLPILVAALVVLIGFFGIAVRVLTF